MEKETANCDSIESKGAIVSFSLPVKQSMS